MPDRESAGAGARNDARAGPEKLTARIYGVMALTTALTFMTLATGYQLLFPPHQMIA